MLVSMFTACTSSAGVVPVSTFSQSSDDKPKDTNRSKSPDRKKHASENMLTFSSKSPTPIGSLDQSTTQRNLLCSLNKNQSDPIPQGLGGTTARSLTSSNTSVSFSGPTSGTTPNPHDKHPSSYVTKQLSNQPTNEKMDIPTEVSDPMKQVKLAAANQMNISPYLI